MAALRVFVSSTPADAAFAERLRQAINQNGGNVVSSPVPASSTPQTGPQAGTLPQREINTLAGAQAFVSVLTPAALADARAQAEAQRYVTTDAENAKHIVVPVELEPLPPQTVWPTLQVAPPVTGPYDAPDIQDQLIKETLRRLGLPPKRNLLLLLVAALLALLVLACAAVLVIPPAGPLHGVIAGAKPTDAPRVATTAIPSPTPTPVGTGLLGQYYRSTAVNYGTPVPDNAFGSLVFSRIDPQVNIRSGDGQYPDPRLAGGAYAIRWTGSIRAQYSETYTFVTHSDDGVRVFVNGQKLIDDWTIHADTQDTATIALTAGQLYDIRVEYYENNVDGAVMTLQWQSPSQPLEVIPQSALYPPPNA